MQLGGAPDETAWLRRKGPSYPDGLGDQVSPLRARPVIGLPEAMPRASVDGPAQVCNPCPARVALIGAVQVGGVS